uniref:ATP-dependent RNA helicase n=1 Tax=Lygus hesperus TaxID=30085 RepID=A0A0A9YS49_LYGHE
MDSLSMNIFVPESKPSPKEIKKKQKTSAPPTPKLTVVKSSSKAPVSPRIGPKLAANAKKIKKSPFIKTKAGKEGKEASKPFLLSEMFDKNEKTSNSVTKKDNETFSVSFVKPKLFQKNSKSSINKLNGSQKPNKKDSLKETHQASGKNQDSGIGDDTNEAGEFEVKFVKPKLFQTKQDSKRSIETANKWDKMIKTVDSKNDDPGEVRSRANFNDEVVNLDEDFSEGFSTEEKGRKLNKNRGSALFEEGAWKSNKSTNKWFGDASRQSGAIQVDFSGIKGKSAETKSKQSDEGARKLKRKFDDGGRDGEKKRRREDFGGKEPPKVSGQMSSLFSYDVAPEPLNDADVEPLEERLFSRKTFEDAGVHPHLVGNLEQLFGIKNMTVVQKKALPELMTGKDGLVRSQTGSGKTLAYAIPIMHSLQAMTPKLTRKDGVKALIVLPTRELALQTYECFTKLMRAFTWIVPGIVVGGEKRKSEKVRLRKGITVLIGTPGRLLDHAQHSENLSLHGIDWLIIDEADKLLEMGYEKDVSQLMSIIDSQREKSENAGRKQTVLLSATLTSAVEKLANLALKDPVHIDACSNIPETVDVMVIPQGLEQKYVVVPAKMRLVALASFIIEVTELRKTNKVLIFMATQDMVDFYMDLIPSVLSSTVKFFKLHGNMSQGDRTEVFNSFRKSEKGVLLSTDVAARGLDLPKVDWIVQYTAPTTPAEYVHRVGRTARVGTKGSSLLFLLPSELHFVTMLNSSRLKLEEVNIDVYLRCLMKIHLESRDGQRWGGGIEGAATVLQHNFESAILEDKTLHDIACKAYKSWVRFYATYPKDLRVVFDFKSLHLGHNAKSFALRDPPRAIGGIGKPKKGEKWGKGSDMRPIRKRKNDNLGHVTESSRTKKLILSEFDSGLKSFKKMK